MIHHSWRNGWMDEKGEDGEEEALEAEEEKEEKILYDMIASSRYVLCGVVRRRMRLWQIFYFWLDANGFLSHLIFRDSWASSSYTCMHVSCTCTHSLWQMEWALWCLCAVMCAYAFSVHFSLGDHYYCVLSTDDFIYINRKCRMATINNFVCIGFGIGVGVGVCLFKYTRARYVSASIRTTLIRIANTICSMHRVRIRMFICAFILRMEWHRRMVWVNFDILFDLTSARRLCLSKSRVGTHWRRDWFESHIIYMYIYI